MARLAQKSFVITGAGSGIGRASALKAAAEGATVAVLDLDGGQARATADVVGEAGGVAMALSVDVTDEEQLAEAMTAVVERHGAITTLVNCAGGSIAEDAPVTDVDLAVWDHTINLDLRGTFLACRTAIPHIAAAGGGTIVNFTSVVALKGAFRGHVYTAAKGGIISLTQALAGRYWRDNIRANAIAPGIVLSDRVRNRLDLPADAPFVEQVETAMPGNRRLVDERHPFGYGVPDDIANIVVFLASDESRMVNGAVIPAEGGAVAY
ncbi:MAG: SDR family NAD(P)-dependent oxidoreductase [Acidimicrobiales bacterium]